MSHIPDYAKSTAWYLPQSNQTFRPQGDESVNAGDATVGTGISTSDSYEAKRDKWLEYDISHWHQTLKSWRPQQNDETNDSDDTDYELELIELGLSQQDIKPNAKNDPMELVMRDRSDIAVYIHNIRGTHGKIKYDPKTRMVLNQEEFVKQLGPLVQFSWEQKQPSGANSDTAADPESMLTHVTQRITAKTKRQKLARG